MATNSLWTIKLFYCYARKDFALRNELDVHLAGLRRSGLITTWYDGEILSGASWENEIEEHLDSAHIILLLVSPDFIASDYCYGTEMKRAIERHYRQKARVIPILLRPADWDNTPFSTLQMLPSNALPVTHWPDRDAAFQDVAKGVRLVVNDLISQRIAAEPAQFQTDSVDDASIPAQPLKQSKKHRYSFKSIYLVVNVLLSQLITARTMQSHTSLPDSTSSSSLPLKRSKKHKLSFFNGIAAAIITILFIIVGIIYVIFQASILANVVVTPRVQQISQVFALSAKPTLQSVDASTSSLPAIILSSDQTVSRTGQTTGQVGCSQGVGGCQPAVSGQDVEKLMKVIRPAARANVQQDLQSQAHDSQCSIVGNVAYADDSQGLSINPLPGAVSNTVTVSQTEQGRVECVRTQDVRTLTLKLLQQQAPQNYTLIDQTIQVGQLIAKDMGKNGIVELSVPTAGVVSYHLSDQELMTIQKHISGMTPKEAQAYIATLPGVDTGSISIRLSFGNIIPANVQQIHVTTTPPTNLPSVQLPKVT